ncbi:hypothetical protein GCM10023347_09560 [Streptomyces chumphonensis]
MQVGTQTGGFQQRPGPFAGGAAWDTGEPQREAHVVHKAELGDEFTELEQETETLQAQFGTLPGGQMVEASTLEADGTGVGGDDAGQTLQKSRLPRPAGSHDGDALTGCNAQGSASEDIGAAQSDMYVPGYQTVRGHLGLHHSASRLLPPTSLECPP